MAVELDPQTQLHTDGRKEGLCTARAKSTGKACTRPAIPGGRVCRFHGGAAPQVREAARQRLAALASLAIAKMATILNAKKNDPHIGVQQQLACARDVLDRSGFKAQDEVIVTAAFDESQFQRMSTEEIRQLVMLARKASSLRDMTDDVEAE
jgi:hypothetical protein